MVIASVFIIVEIIYKIYKGIKLGLLQNLSEISGTINYVFFIYFIPHIILVVTAGALIGLITKKDWSHWSRGGLIGVTISLALMVPYFILTAVNTFIVNNGQFFWGWPGYVGMILPVLAIFMVGLPTVTSWIVGAIIGLIVGKIKPKKKK